MELSTINGLPAHALLVHAVVILVPLACLTVVAAAFWPAARRRLGIATPLIALIALISVPLATNAGEWLEDHVQRTDLVRAHTRLGDELLPWAIGVFVVAVLVWALPRYRARRTASGDTPTGGQQRTRPGNRTGVLVTVVLCGLALAAGIGASVQVYRIGESGARAVWQDSYSATPVTTPAHQGDEPDDEPGH